jgi:hypothetical protein
MTLTISRDGAIVPPGTPLWDELAREHEQRMQEQWASADGYRVKIQTNAGQVWTGGTLRLAVAAYPMRRTADRRSIVGGRLSLAASPADVRPREPVSPERTGAKKDEARGVRKSFRPEVKLRPVTSGPGSGAAWLLRDLLPDLGRTYGVGFLSDAYWESPSITADEVSAQEPITLAALLDRLAGERFRWDHRGNLVRLRSRSWFFERPREVPLRLIRRWQALHETRGALPIDAYVEMAVGLTERQVAGLPSASVEAGLPLDFWDVYPSRHVLRLYASLLPAQQQALWQGTALSVARMSPAQQTGFMKAVQDRLRNRPAPLIQARWDAGSLSLTTESFVRIREQVAGSPRYREERAPTATAEPRAPADGDAPDGRQSATPGSPPTPRTRHPVTRLRFRLQCGPEISETFLLTIAAPA